MAISFNYTFHQFGYNVQLSLTASGGPVASNQYLITNAAGSVNGSQVVQLYGVNGVTNLSAVGNNNIVDTTAASTGYIVGTNSVGFRTADGNNYTLNYFAGFTLGGMVFFPAALRLQINSNGFIDVSNGTYSYQNVSLPVTEIIAVTLSADTGSDTTDFITNVESQTISGTLDNNLASGEFVEVSFDNGSTWINATSYSVGSSSWSHSTTLVGDGVFKARVSNGVGTGTAYSHAYTVDTTDPVTVVSIAAMSDDSGISNSDLITNVAVQNISGTLSANLGAGELVQVSLDDGTTWVNATTIVGQNAWTLSGQVLTGSNTLKVRVEDASGNAGAVSSYSYSFDQAAPSAAVAATSLDVGTNVTTAQSSELGLVYLVDAAATITDLASLSALVTGGLASEANITAVGTNTSISTTGLLAGVYKVYAVDAAGNVSAASVNDITLASPVVVGGGSAPPPVFDIQVVNEFTGSAGMRLTGDRLARGSYDHITGSGGNDTLIGCLGNDTLVGGSGFDEIRGGRGNDSLQGGLNADTLFGGRGNDMLEGGRGQDALNGGIGRDTLSGGVGNDLMTGGDGADVFIFMNAVDGLSNIDVITDFVSGTDRIQLSVSVFTALAEQVGQTVGLSQYITYNAATGELCYDEDGSGAGSPKAFAVLGAAAHPASIGNDFWVVA